MEAMEAHDKGAEPGKDADGSGGCKAASKTKSAVARPRCPVCSYDLHACLGVMYDSDPLLRGIATLATAAEPLLYTTLRMSFDTQAQCEAVKQECCIVCHKYTD